MRPARPLPLDWRSLATHSSASRYLTVRWPPGWILLRQCTGFVRASVSHCNLHRGVEFHSASVVYRPTPSSLATEDIPSALRPSRPARLVLSSAQSRSEE